MEEKEYNVVVLDNNQKYAEISKIEHNSETYLFLANIKDYQDFRIRKIVQGNDNDMLVGLDNKEEFDMVLKLFAESNLN